MMQLKVATEYRGSASFMCNYNLIIRTLICINLNDPTLGMGLDVRAIYIVVLLHRCSQITVNQFK